MTEKIIVVVLFVEWFYIIALSYEIAHIKKIISMPKGGGGRYEDTR